MSRVILDVYTLCEWVGKYFTLFFRKNTHVHTCSERMYLMDQLRYTYMFAQKESRRGCCLRRNTYLHRYTQIHTDTHRYTQTHTDTHVCTRVHTDTHRYSTPDASWWSKSLMLDVNRRVVISLSFYRRKEKTPKKDQKKDPKKKRAKVVTLPSVHVHICIFVCVCKCIFFTFLLRVHVCILVYVCTCIYACTCMRMCVRNCVSVCVCVSVSVFFDRHIQ